MSGWNSAERIALTGVIAQWLTFLTLFASLLYARRTLKHTQETLRHTQEATRAHNFLSLVQYLQSSEVRAAKEHVISSLATKVHTEWTANDKAQASTFCGAYGTVGVLLRLGFISYESIESYKPSVTEAFRICKPFIDERGRQVSGHWRDLVELNKRFLDA